MTHRKPLIGVPAQTLQAIDGIPEDLPHSWVMNHRYFTVLASVGASPVMIPLLRDVDVLRGIYEGLDGVFLAGGVDVDPSSYHEPREELCGRTDLDRDFVEMQFARWAREDDKPLFGICRGLQVMNVDGGGSLYQDCEEFYENSVKHDYFPTAGFARDHIAHEVTLAPDSRLREIMGADAVRVNSMHHQGLKRVAEGLVPVAFAPDGLIEALEAPDASFCMGVQWHPEMLVDTDLPTRRLFETFVEASARYAAGEVVRTG